MTSLFDFLTGKAQGEGISTTGIINLSSPTKKQYDIMRYEYDYNLYAPQTTTTTTTTNTISPTYTYAPTIISGSPSATANPIIRLTSEPIISTPITPTAKIEPQVSNPLAITSKEEKSFSSSSESLGGILANTSTLLIVAVGGYLLWKLLK